MENKNYRILWDPDMEESYLYGAELMLAKQGTVRYQSELLPPGTVITAWHARTMFGDDQKEPLLPILEEESTYEIQMACASVPEGTVYAQLIFRDLRGRECGRFLLHEGKDQFIYPKGAFSYDLELVQGGAKSFQFEYISISKV